MTTRVNGYRTLSNGRAWIGVAGLCLCLLGLARPLVAETQEQPLESGKGFYLGMRFIGSSLHVDEGEEDVFFVKDDGGGVQFQAGYRFNSVFALELSAGGAHHDTSDPRIDGSSGFVDIFGLYRFVPGQPFRPYIKGGIGGCGLKLKEGDVEATINGGGIALGGGFDYFFSRYFSLGADLTHHIIQYNEVELRLGDTAVSTEIDEEGAMTSLGLTLTYYF